MRIVILTGGTGSIALQRGLYDALEAKLDGTDVKILVNAYDNGLSTGAVREVMHRRILGPSDVRKNQTTRLQLECPDSPWLGFLNWRFTVNPPDAQDLCRRKVDQLITELTAQGLPIAARDVLMGAIDEFFKSSLAAATKYNDFSLANIIYAGLAGANGNSLRAAATTMSSVLGIADNVLLNDDESLFLGAITRSGRKIADEGRIVSWENYEDPFVDIFFTTAEGYETRPTLCLEAWRAIVEAHLIVLSSGTQWSSLIPTYASKGFAAAVKDSRAKIVMVMNRTPDKDAPSQTASDIIDALVPHYFEAGRVHVLADRNGHPTMRGLSRSSLEKVASFTQADLSRPCDRLDKHAPDLLTEAIGQVFFNEHLQSEFYLFDYDDTLVGRGNRWPLASGYNVRGLSRLNWLTRVGICSGNTIDAIRLKGEPAHLNEASEPIYKPLLIFADGGINGYIYDTCPNESGSETSAEPAICISPETLLPAAGLHCANRIAEFLRKAGIPEHKITNRGNALIAIKPVDSGDRRALLCLIRHLVDGTDLQPRECGRTTLEICRASLSKATVVRYLRSRYSATLKITYVGDEFDSGNDRDIEEIASKDERLQCLRVDGPAQTAFFIRTLMAQLCNNVGR